MRIFWLSSLWLAGCAPVAEHDTDGLADHDADGLVAANDCNDDDASIFPGADEVVGDGIDQDCDGNETCFADLDADGYHADATVEDADLACSAAGETDATGAAGDCADDDPTRHPGAAETCGAADVDEDCDGLIDGEDPDVLDCFDWSGTYTGPLDLTYGIDHAFAARCLGTVTAVVDAAGGFTITGDCAFETSYYADEFGTQHLSGVGASTGSYFAGGTAQLGPVDVTWKGDFRPGILTVTVAGYGSLNEHSVMIEGGFVASL